MSKEMRLRGKWLDANNELKLTPFRPQLYYVTNSYDLQCLTVYLKSATIPDLLNKIDWSGEHTVEHNYTLINYTAGDHGAGYYILYAPIMERMVPGDVYVGLLARLHALLVRVCMEVVTAAGYNPSTGCVMFGHLVAEVYYQLCNRIGSENGTMITYVTNEQRLLVLNMPNHQWEYVNSLPELALYSAARDMNKTLANGTVIEKRDGWFATTYFS